MKVRIAVSILWTLFTVFVGWYGGIEYSERGVPQAFFVVFAAMLGGACYSYPGWKSYE